MSRTTITVGRIARQGVANEQTPAQPKLPPEKPYIPEQTAASDASYHDTNSNVLDGNGSNAFKTARFGSSGSGSTVHESDATGGGTEGSSKRDPSVMKGGKTEKIEGKPSEPQLLTAERKPLFE